MALSVSGVYLTHQQKVLRLYKRALRHLESWCVHRDKYRYFACLMRARFEEHKNEKDMMKATQLLKEAEEEFWYFQHPQPYIFPDSPGGTSYERYDCYKVPEWCLDDWHPSEKAMYPDYFAKREQWKKLRRESWEREVRSTCTSIFLSYVDGVKFSPHAEVQIPDMTVTLGPYFSDILW
uniref:NADH dehydrogenase [ubiquinone] 1 beta subcomplex subunit 9 n=2 Tax=Cercopithecinae TaxID=9528 RepID=A0A2I3MPQ3_PAPAN